MLKMMAPSSGDQRYSRTGLLAVPATATAAATATATAATAAAGHYGDPSKGPCLAGEENVNVQGAGISPPNLLWAPCLPLPPTLPSPPV